MNIPSVLAKTVVLDDTAYREWRDRPHPFVKGVILIVVVSLMAGLITYATDLAYRIRPVNAIQLEKTMRDSFEQSLKWNPVWQNMEPEARRMAEKQMDVIVDMVTDLAQIESPLPRRVGGFFGAFASFLSRASGALAGWLFYGALVLIAANLLGGSAKLPDFLGMVSLYTIPGLLGLLGWIPCLGPLLGLAGWIWGIVMYAKAVSVVSDLNTDRAILATLAPAVIILLLGILLSILSVFWLFIVL